MATRGTIAVQLEDGSVMQVYSHWDNYLNGTGRLLIEHYRDLDAAIALVQHGDISSLGKRVFPEGDHSFDRPEPDTTVYYGRDRGETDVEPKTYSTVSDCYTFGQWEEYNYLFRNGEWEVISYATDNTWRSVKEALELEAAREAE